jgi:endogenous inhibitor of DNA gyrase (YacG/DUF329 family)
MMKAQHARNIMNDKTADALGKIGGMVDKATMRESGGFRLSPTQLQRALDLADGMPLQTSVGNQSPLQTSVLQTSVEAYRKAEEAAAGTIINCPNCGKPFKKANRFHIFCSHSRNKREDGGNCSDEWHNAKDPARMEALKAKSRRRKA